MVWLQRLWKWGSALTVGVFVAGYLLTLVAHNIYRIFDNSPNSEWENRGIKVLSATGTTQRWNMFAPNVGTFSYSPIVVLVFEDGSRISLHSQVEPDLPGWDGGAPIPNTVEGDARNYEWRFHFADGRIRKFESNASKTDAGWFMLRTHYARWRATTWLEQHPDRRKDLRRIELWRAAIRHPGYGNELHCESTEILTIYPQLDGKWPIPIDTGFPYYRY